MTRIALTLALALLACTDAPADTAAAAVEPTGEATADAAPPPPAEAVIAALRTRPGEGLWPGFLPADVPAALFDGQRTLLVAHPSPPAGFQASPDLPGVAVYAGRHPAVRGNMPTEIDSVRVAAVLLEMLGGMTAERAAAVVTHERFHVHQLETHPTWTANELALFQNPSTDAQQLFDRRLETLALHRSVQARTPDQTECWLRTALLLRQKRLAQLPPAVAAFERAIELQEGVARYIERRAAGLETPPDIAPHGYPPEEVRARAYVTGETLALMLDRYAPGWKETVERAEGAAPALDSLLWLALAERPEMSCGFSAAERADVLERARAAVDVTRAQREAALRAFEEQQGWSVEVVSEARPLWPQSFDPMSVTRVGSAGLVHQRMLRAGNEAGHIDVFDRPALSVGYADDPMGTGMSAVRVKGLPAEPTVVEEDGRVRITAPGLEVSLQGGHLTRRGQEIVVRLR